MAAKDLKSTNTMDMLTHCLWSEVIPAAPLENLIRNRSKFRLMHYDPTKFNVFHVIEKETQDDLFRLKEEILEVVSCPELKLNDQEDPYVGEVVLAPHPEHNQSYYRSYIEKIHFAPVDSWKIDPNPEESSAFVYFFDVGGYYEIKLKDLKPVTKQIMMFPVLGYRVNLFTRKRHPDTDDFMIFEGNGLLWSETFVSAMTKLKRVDLIISIEMEELLYPKYQGTDVFNTYPVTIKYQIRGKMSQVSDKLEQLKVWEWESVVQAHKDDDDFNDDAFMKIVSCYNKTETPITVYRLNSSGEFTAEVTRVLKRESHFVGKSEIRVILLDDQFYKNNLSVLQSQMDRYAELVKKSVFYPSIKDVFMFKLDVKDEYKKLGIKRLGVWCRAVKINANWIYLMDWDDNIPLNGVEEDDYEIRPLFAEFLRIPSLVVTIFPHENGVPMDYVRAMRSLAPGRRFRFRAGSASPENVEFLKPKDQNNQEPFKPEGIYRIQDDSSDSSSTTTTTTTTSTSTTSSSTSTESDV